MATVVMFVYSPILLVAFVVTHEGTAGVFCGDTQAAWRHAAALSARRHIVWVEGQFDRVLSIMPPASAVSFAKAAAEAMRSAGRSPLFADLNAISPETTRQVQQIVEGAGAVYVDGGIIGRSPGIAAIPTRIYVSGPAAARLEEFAYGEATAIAVVLLVI